MAIIGDVHGKIPEYLAIRAKYEKSLQLGDMGIGFRGVAFPDRPGHQFFRGNHDDPRACRDHPSYAKDFGMHNGIFIVSGGFSVDAKFREPGVTWWADEELAYDDLQTMVGEYEKEKPSVVISHEAPFRIHPLLKAAAVIRDPDTERWGPPKGNRTAFALDEMLKIHLPDLWIFGHWHVDLSFRLKKSLKTQLVCLDELSVYELEC